MKYLIGFLIVLFLLRLVIGAFRGQVRVGSCCAPADPRQDARMRASGSTAPRGDRPAGR